MYIIVAGAGIVGFHVASLLAEANHEVTVVEPSEEVVEGVRRQLDVKTIVGNAATPRILREAEVNRANLIIAVTNNDETNMLICFLAKELGAVMTAARVRNPDYSGYFITAAKSPSAARKVIRPKTLGINLIINPEVELADAIMGMLSNLYPTPGENFADGRVQIREFRVDHGALAGKALADVSLPQPGVVAAISRSGKTFVPAPDEVIKKGDHVYLVAHRESMDEFCEMFAPPQHPVRNVVVFGAGRVGFLVAEGLEKHGLTIKVIDESTSRCQEIAARLERATVLQGDATDPDFLIEQGIPSADAFIATTESDELNILCSLLAKNLGVSRTIITANKPGYVSLAEAIGVDVAVSSLLQVASRVTHFVLHGGAISAPFIGGKDVQAIEFVTSTTANIAQRSIAEAGLPKGVVAGAIARDDTVIIPPNDSVINPGDHVIIVSSLSATPAVERLFK
ncbi:MAG: Trk system potassium transporter TrkA [Dehalococcoidales bacterium]|nr:MAG: Trk system potassium transporter TrkA [Dehalococcoidales bacterium]